MIFDESLDAGRGLPATSARGLMKETHVDIKTVIAGRLRQAADAFSAPAEEVQEKPTPVGLLDEYVQGLPTPQNAVDALPGWNTALPPQAGAIAGPMPLYHDPRILWALKQFGPLTGKTVLELGPLEGSHSFMLEQEGPAMLHCIEANRLSFLRCLVVKELL